MRIPTSTTISRPRRSLLAIFASALFVAACGGGEEAQQADDAPEGADAATPTPTAAGTPFPTAQAAASPESSAEGSAPGAFPVTITHLFGATEITEAPERVVALSSAAADTAAALGVAPVAVSQTFGLERDSLAPWFAPAVEAGQVEVLDLVAGIPFERIAAVEPDVILAQSAFTDQGEISEQDYELLSEIAPTIAAQVPDFSSPGRTSRSPSARCTANARLLRSSLTRSRPRWTRSPLPTRPSPGAPSWWPTYSPQTSSACWWTPRRAPCRC